jgi:RNA polymerase sigma-70 factor (ECF subfamily)
VSALDLERPAELSRHEDKLERGLHLAKSGSPEALNHVLQTCRNYLLLIANREIDSELKVKVAASDLVQETLFEASRNFGKFDGETDADVRAWVRRILLNNLAEVRDRFRGTLKREMQREMSIPADRVFSPINNHIANETPAIGKLIRRESLDALQEALSSLPEQYHEVLMLRNRDGLSFEDIGTRMNRSAEAARELW